MLSSVNTRVLTCGGIGRLLPTHTGLSPARSGQRENPITGPNSSSSDRAGRTSARTWKGSVDYSAQLVYDSARNSSGDSRGTARLIAVDHRDSLVEPSA